MPDFFQLIESIESREIEPPCGTEQGPDDWTFSLKIPKSDAKQAAKFFRPWIKRHALLRLEYSVVCTKLSRAYLAEGLSDSVKQQLKIALEMAETLEQLYGPYLRVNHEVRRMRQDQAVYRWALGLNPKPIDTDAFKLSSQNVLELTAAWNVMRLLIVRTRRFILTLSLIFDDFEKQTNFSGIIDNYAGPITAYLSWIFFIPRLATNLSLLIKHLLPITQWMDEEEKKLGMWARFVAQMERRWFDIFNDLAWISVGIINCFFVSGPWALYIGAILQGYDIVLAGIRATIEMNRLSKLAEAYGHNGQDYLEELNDRIAYERKRLTLLVINATVVCLAFALLLPLFSNILSVFPFIGACVLVATTFISWGFNKYLEKTKPLDKLTKDMIQKPAESEASTAVAQPDSIEHEGERSLAHEDRVEVPAEDFPKPAMLSDPDEENDQDSPKRPSSRSVTPSTPPKSPRFFDTGSASNDSPNNKERRAENPLPTSQSAPYLVTVSNTR